MENTCILAACYYSQGKIEESAKLRDELYSIGLHDKVDLVQGWALLQKAEVAILQEDYESSGELLKKAFEIESSLGQPDKVWLHGLHALTSARLKDFEGALSSAYKTLALAKQSLPTSFFVLEGYSGMVEALMLMYGENTSDKRLLKQINRSMAAFGKFASSFPIGKPRLYYWKGKIAHSGGKPDKAANLWNIGLGHSRKMTMILEEERLNKAINLLQS